jgi:hypothetical protein
MHQFPLSVVIGLVCGLVSGGAMAACQSNANSLFEDRFRNVDDSWGTFQNYRVENGRLVFKPLAGFNTAAINKSSLYDDVDACVEMTVPAPTTKGTCGALIFWAEDYGNYYSFQVSTDGQASVWRRQRGKWLDPVSWRDFGPIAKNADEVNELRVVTAGSNAKLFVNGTLFKELRGHPPKDGSLVGLLACAPNDVSATVAFTNFVVNPPSADTESTNDKATGERKGGNAAPSMNESGGPGSSGESGGAAGGAAPVGSDTGK